MPAIGRPLGPSRARPGSGPWSLRPVARADAPALARLERELFPDEAWSLEMVLEEIAHPSRRYVAAVDENDGVLGYAGIFLAGESADVQTIGTVREGAGIGRALLAWCEDRAREEGAEGLFLEVRCDNSRARELYERAGFVEIGVRRGYYRTPAGPIDAIAMRKPLSPPWIA
ncbi:GNAT family N-acetyltransferase [Dermabacter vaginalis]|uniref:GNAT family N-acetyltransferase n=1 Tax=Dermabacter vaginalis TaxID=1630135 RepID=UPI001CC276FD|nr:GNAT family N-acetyltransferase [Dermabacter vaginalis]